jgi:hypothetical protein
VIRTGARLLKTKERKSPVAFIDFTSRQNGGW